MDKENYGAWYSKANVLERLERDKEALAAWEKASVSYTVAAERHITNIKQKLQKQEQKEQSRKKFQEGKDFENKKEYTKALTIYEEVTKLNPENEDAFFRKGL